ncbi:hypothetical protein M514_05473 [Trichuris suis]|uniref:26S proteasome non-ATPase regulatory subunit 8 n=1 Tax=Trichuris suis TaxID=68888 RepID=A0A085NJM4_9BILA|nr:hypothetical protein M514_05473 [Trichuris suis]
MEEVKLLYNELLSEWNKDNKDFNKILSVIDNIKGCFIDFNFVPSDLKDLELEDMFLMQQHVLEIEGLVNIACRDIKAFLRTVLELRHYYMDTEFQKLHPQVKESPMKYEMIALHLMCLLANNDSLKIHREIERLPFEVALNNPFISFAVKLEECLMVGAYSKFFISVANPPSPYCAYFLEIMNKTIRDQIADGIEKSYSSLKVSDAAELLNFTGPSAIKDLNDFLAERWERTPDGTGFVFQPQKVLEPDYVDDLSQIMQQQLYFAKQLETIV